MKIVIDIPETVYEAFKEWHKNKVATVEQSLIANGIPYEERPTGHWFLLDECANEGVYCSNCHKKVYRVEYANQKLKSNFCPNCGADMRGKKNETN